MRRPRARRFAGARVVVLVGDVTGELIGAFDQQGMHGVGNAGELLNGGAHGNSSWLVQVFCVRYAHRSDRTRVVEYGNCFGD